MSPAPRSGTLTFSNDGDMGMFRLRSTSPLALATWGLTALLPSGGGMPACQAAKVRVWTQQTAVQFEKAQFQGAVVSNQGVLALSRQLKPLAGLEVAHVWDLVEDRSGNLFVAT